MLHDAGEERVFVVRWGDGDMGVGGAACAVGERAGVEGSAEAVAGGDIYYGLAGFEEGVDCSEGGGRREDEFELGGGGLGVELFQVDVDRGEGVDDLFEKWEKGLGFGCHSGPGVVRYCRDVFDGAVVVGCLF